MTSQKIANYVKDMIAESGKTQSRIASDMGLSSHNMITYVKNGKSKIPFDMIKPLCEACEYDHKELMRLVIEEYLPTVDKFIDELLELERERARARWEK